MLLSLPLFHIFGLAAGFLQVCWVGATVVLAEQLDADAGRRHPRHAAGERARGRADDVPRAARPARRATCAPPPRACGCAPRAARPLPPEWLAAFQQATGLAIVEGYGLTEAGPIVTTNPLGRAAQARLGRPRAAGRRAAAGDADGRPIGPDDDDGATPDDGTGLVALRGPNLFSGYWPDGAGGPDAEGWFRTADVGFLDADGDLHLVDRSSDVVIVNGFNVYPREVEQVLLAIEGVTEAAVVGQRDERAGEVVKAVLVTDPAAGVDEAAVREFCAQRLARFKVPAVITFVDALPRTPTGKIARRQLALS